jgi:predicted AAA+ superfamily ATPase
LIGYYVAPFHKKVKRDLIQSTPKFYLFDVGVANHLQHRTINVLKGEEAGASFEHYILTELVAYLGLNEIDTPVNYWRSKSGLEVDFVLGHGKVAIETKISTNIDLTDLRGLVAFCEDYQPRHALVVCQAPRKRIITTVGKTTIEILPWKDFMDNLWSGQYQIS